MQYEGTFFIHDNGSTPDIGTIGIVFGYQELFDKSGGRCRYLNLFDVQNLPRLREDKCVAKVDQRYYDHWNLEDSQTHFFFIHPFFHMTDNHLFLGSVSVVKFYLATFRRTYYTYSTGCTADSKSGCQYVGATIGMLCLFSHVFNFLCLRSPMISPICMTSIIQYNNSWSAKAINFY